MIIYSGIGYLVPVFFIAPLVIAGSILNYGFGIDVLESSSWWPLHSMIILGAIVTFAVGALLNRNMLVETTFEKSGPVRVLRPRHTLYYIRIEYWGPILLAIYFAFIAYRSYR